VCVGHKAIKLRRVSFMPLMPMSSTGAAASYAAAGCRTLVSFKVAGFEFFFSI
jgi:hypothetical protein